MPVEEALRHMRRRLDLAASLIAQPPLIFLAQPTTGLDPRTRGQMRDTIRALVATGSAVVLATPYLDEADRLADRITVIDRSRVVAEGTADAGHELRTPLTLLSTRAQLLRRELADGPAGRIDAPRARDGLDETVADVRALTGVLEDLLIAADSRRDAERAPVDLTAEAGAVVAALRTEAAARGIAMVPGAHARPRHRHVVQMPERSDGNPARAQYSGTRRLLRMKKAPPTTRRLPRAARRI